ncbi:MAG TPA: hypothetical protein PK323_11490 [Bacteroidia bacterium]|nr:hypothetical protein [Bacteroidia bacterium]
MKQFIYSLILSSLFVFSSCEKDEGLLPNLSFVALSGAITADTNLPKGAPFKIKVTASKSEGKDVLKKFNVSTSINGASETTIEDKSLSGAEGDIFNYEYNGTADTIVGKKTKYIYTVTNRDGITNQISLTVTVQ